MKKLATFLGALGVVMMTPLAHANLTISYQVNSGAIVQCQLLNSDTVNQCAASIAAGGGVTINGLSGSSNSPGGAPFNNANQSGSTVSIIATNPVGTPVGGTTVKLWFSAPNFNFPTAPPDIAWIANLQFTSSSPGTNAGTINQMNCLDLNNGNTPGGVAPGFCTNVADPKMNNGGLAWAGTTTPVQDTVHTTISNLTAPYALQQVVTIVFTDPGQLNVVTSQTLTPVPEPMSVALLGGVLLVSAGAIRRKRAQASRS